MQPVRTEHSTHLKISERLGIIVAITLPLETTLTNWIDRHLDYSSYVQTKQEISETKRWHSCIIEEEPSFAQLQTFRVLYPLCIID